MPSEMAAHYKYHINVIKRYAASVYEIGPAGLSEGSFL